MNRQRVLFLCTHNSARSQMAEGWLRHLAGARYEVQSAGTERRSVHPMAIQVMGELGIDISRHTSKLLVGLMPEPWDYVITVCDSANEKCPLFPGKTQRLHWSFPDPSTAVGTDDEKLVVFRRIRDQIRDRLGSWIVDQQER